MAKVEILNIEGGGRLALIKCPGCGYDHPFHIDKPAANGAMWTFNGDVDKPTFTPSLMVFGGDSERQCHSYVTDGKIQFLGDCFHELKNQTVELPDIEE